MHRPFWNTAVMAEDKDTQKAISLSNDNPEFTQSGPPSSSPSGPGHDEAKPEDFACIERWKKKSCGQVCLEVWYVVVGVVTMILCLSDIVVTISSSLANKLYDSEQSAHLIAMVVLAGLSAVVMSIVIYSILGVCRTHVKSLTATAYALFLIAIVQALLTGLVVNVTENDHRIVGKSLSSSFNQSQAGSQRHMTLWAQTQYELECCGMYGAEDYRVPNIPYLFPPDVPVSCCPTYDANVPEHAQERARELCKANREYYKHGCRPAVEQIFNHSAIVVVIVTSLLILLEVVLAITAACLSKRNEKLLKVETEKV